MRFRMAFLLNNYLIYNKKGCHTVKVYFNCNIILMLHKYSDSLQNVLFI